MHSSPPPLLPQGWKRGPVRAGLVLVRAEGMQGLDPTVLRRSGVLTSERAAPGPLLKPSSHCGSGGGRDPGYPGYCLPAPQKLPSCRLRLSPRGQALGRADWAAPPVPGVRAEGAACPEGHWEEVRSLQAGSETSGGALGTAHSPGTGGGRCGVPVSATLLFPGLEKVLGHSPMRPGLAQSGSRPGLLGCHGK